MKIKSEYVLKQLSGEYIVVPSGKEAISFQGVITLNKSGAVLFEQLQKGAKQEELVELLLDTYEVTRETALRDVDTFIKIVKDHQLLET